MDSAPKTVLSMTKTLMLGFVLTIKTLHLTQADIAHASVNLDLGVTKAVKDMSTTFITLVLVVMCMVGIGAYDAGMLNERTRLENKCLTTQTTQYAEAVKFCKEQVK